MHLKSPATHSTACLVWQQRKHWSSALLVLCEGILQVTSGLSSQRANNTVWIIPWDDIILKRSHFLDKRTQIALVSLVFFWGACPICLAASWCQYIGLLASQVNGPFMSLSEWPSQWHVQWNILLTDCLLQVNFARAICLYLTLKEWMEVYCVGDAWLSFSPPICLFGQMSKSINLSAVPN